MIEARDGVAKPKRPKVEDEEQSRRFLDLAAELEAAGDLNLDEGERGLDTLPRNAREKPTKGEST